MEYITRDKSEDYKERNRYRSSESSLPYITLSKIIRNNNFRGRKLRKNKLIYAGVVLFSFQSCVLDLTDSLTLFLSTFLTVLKEN